MPKLKTVGKLLLNPVRLIKAMSEKMSCFSQRISRLKSPSITEFAYRLRNKWRVLRDVHSCSAHAMDPLGRNASGAPKVMVYSALFGSPGTLASTNYYLNWVLGLRQAGADPFILAPRVFKKPEITLGRLSQALYYAPFKMPFFNGDSIFKKECPDIVLFHNDSFSLEFAKRHRHSDALFGWFIGDAMTHRIIDERARRDHIAQVVTYADMLVVVSEYLKQVWIGYGFDPEKIFVTKTPVDAKSWPVHVGSETGATAGYFGNIYHKEIENLLEISKLVATQRPDFKLCIYGDGRLEDLLTLRGKIDSSGLNGTVSLHHGVSVDEMRAIQSKLDFLLLPREKAEFSDAGFPNKIGEYLASGAVTISTKISNLEQILSDGENIILVEPNCNEVFATALLNAMEHFDEVRIMAKKGREFIAEYASCERIAREFIAWIEERENAKS